MKKYLHFSCFCHPAAALDDAAPEEVKEEIARLEQSVSSAELNKALEGNIFDLSLTVDDTLQKADRRVQQQRRRQPFQQPMAGVLLPNVLSNPALAGTLMAPAPQSGATLIQRSTGGGTMPVSKPISSAAASAKHTPVGHGYFSCLHFLILHGFSPSDF